MTPNNQLHALCCEYAKCQACSFGKTAFAHKPPFRVFYRGSAPASLMFVGEAPGKREVAYGQPFIGPSGDLLNRILLWQKIPANDIFITNSIICNGDGVSKPTNEAIDACNDRLKKMIEIVRPSIIVCLGKFATQAVLGKEIVEYPLKDWLGQVLKYRVEHPPIYTFVEYHPAYLLRNPRAKAASVERWKNIGACYHHQKNIRLSGV